MSTTVIHQPLSDTAWDKSSADAQNTLCGVAHCDGSQHESGVSPSAWLHEVVSEKFDGETVSASVTIGNGKIEGFMDYQANGEMTAADFRTEADNYEAFPAWLRKIADRMDALNA